MKLVSNIASPIRRYAAVIVSVFCLLALYIFVSIGYRSVLGPVIGGVVGGVAAVIALVLLNRTEQSGRQRTPLDPRISVIVAGSYVTAIIVMYRFVSYGRPWLHYLVFGAYAGYVAYEIATGANRARVVPQLLVLTFFTYWTTQFAFPAGMYGPDTKYRYLPAIHTALTQGAVPNSQLIYLGHLVYVVESTLLTGMSAETTYYLLSVLALTGTVLLLSVIDVVLPSIPRQVCLYAALIFGCMSWTLGRGFHPNKLNFFYPLILLIGLSALGLYTSSTSEEKHAWMVISAVTAPAIIFGHQFSAGAALIFLTSIAMFAILASQILHSEYESLPRGTMKLFVGAYGLAVLGNPIHQGPLLGRLVGLIVSVFAPSGGGGGGPGRYSHFSLDFLLVNTSSQAILFAFAIFGAAVAIRRADWEYDLGIFWMGVLAVFLVVSLVFNSADTQPQRFYSLLGLFGLNLFVGVAFVYLIRVDINWFSERSIATVVVVFAILSLASPVAGMYLSPFGDEVPHFRQFDTHQLTEGSQWVNEYTAGDAETLRTTPPDTELPYTRVSSNSVMVNVSDIPEGNVYVYTPVAKSTGVTTGGGLSIGGRNFAFLRFNSRASDGIIYTNGETRAYLREPQTKTLISNTGRSNSSQ